jgi:hypothetical protein
MILNDTHLQIGSLPRSRRGVKRPRGAWPPALASRTQATG